jgi:hypothetical protein
MNYKKTIRSAMFLLLGFGGLHAKKNPSPQTAMLWALWARLLFRLGKLSTLPYTVSSGSVVQGVK